MAVARIVRTVTTEEAIELIWEKVLDGTYEGPAEATRALWPSFSFEATSLELLALVGLEHLAGREQRHTRRSTRGGRPAIGYGAPHGKKWERYIGLTWALEDADGKLRSIIDWADEDYAALALRTGKLVATYKRQQEFADLGQDLLKEHGKTVTYDLPAAALKRLDEAAREALGRQA
jgi:hypothetical protein